jgi:hypothetical protein
VKSIQERSLDWIQKVKTKWRIRWNQPESSDPPITYDQLAYGEDLKLHYKLQSTIDQAWGLVKLAVEPAIRERAKEHLSPRDSWGGTLPQQLAGFSENVINACARVDSKWDSDMN